MAQILRGEVKAAELPLIRVVRDGDGRLFSLDNRRLFCFRECHVGKIAVELIPNVASTDWGEDVGGGANEEYRAKRFGPDNGTKCDGTALELKPANGSKSALASVAACLPCEICGTTATERLRRFAWVKGSKHAVPANGCDGCAKLIKFAKK